MCKPGSVGGLGGRPPRPTRPRPRSPRRSHPKCSHRRDPRARSPANKPITRQSPARPEVCMPIRCDAKDHPNANTPQSINSARPRIKAVRAERADQKTLRRQTNGHAASRGQTEYIKDLELGLTPGSGDLLTSPASCGVHTIHEHTIERAPPIPGQRAHDDRMLIQLHNNMQVTHTLFFRFQHKHIEVASILPMMQVPYVLDFRRTAAVLIVWFL